MTEFLIGLMSGTSMDSVDAALVRFTDDRPHLIEKHHMPLPPALREALRALSRPGENELDRAARLDSAIARLFAEAVQTLLSKAGLAPPQIRAIGSHGQTVRHAPTGPEPYTVQIGNPNLIAELTGIPTVADFRRRDMAAGGQGAPLAPVFHNAFFRQPGEARVVINIGGIANITILPADPGTPVSGFDTGPGNVLLDTWVGRHLGLPMDRDGEWAKQGRFIPALLKRCLDDDYLALPPPKSTGLEYFNHAWLEDKLALWGGVAEPQDVQATLIEFTAQSIAIAIQRHAPATQRVLIGGGGVHNLALLASLSRHLGDRTVESTAAQGIDPDYLEAIGFAWLAKRTLHKLPGNLPEVTGASGPRILGVIYPA